ncbi:Type III restriction-modification enzyme helicase subunit [hydrothermal vent metagenome]|uniref:Type III restriction-modification enzyme helicase subunit n=1 Tax=hydrothermal vent metagenome TaxID=652676 RepID=A0A3B0W5R3_9ZZZZ
MSERILNNISGRLSLRPPQRESLDALKTAIDSTVVENVISELLNHKHDVPALLDILKSQFTKLEDFEREFPSLCFALATGVGKTRLMGAFVSYLHLAHGINNFFVLAPNLTIYDKLIADFTPGSPKYVFKGIAEFAVTQPVVITGDNYEERGAQLSQDLFGQAQEVRINIFNISKIVSEVRGGKAPRIKRLSEYLGDSYFNYLSELDDLVLLMDESHRYRANAGMKAINELNPILGLELTATPFTESARGTVPFKNVVVDYPLARAMDDGFVKEPAVVTQRNFDASQYSREELERIKLMDGIRLHEQTKVELMTYSKQNDLPLVKPFMLVIARDTTHAAELLSIMGSNGFFDGRYQGKIIQVDSSKSGAAEEEMISRLLAVESVDEPTEVVIHVNMLKEGWDVTNLYTIVPLRAANARTLIEQSIGRGLRLPYGKRTGVEPVDRLSIVAHDRFQEIIDEANNPENPLRLKQLILDAPEDETPMTSVDVGSNLTTMITGTEPTDSDGVSYEGSGEKLVFNGETERKVAETTLKVINSFKNKPEIIATTEALDEQDVQQIIITAVKEELTEDQMSLLVEEETDLAEVVAKTSKLVKQQTIDIPKIAVTPKGEVNYGYQSFMLDVSQLNLQPSERDLVSQSLQTNLQTTPVMAQIGITESRPENYIIHQLVDFDDISYDEHADLLYDLTGQVVEHFRSYLSSEEEVVNVLDSNRRLIGNAIHAQMIEHFWEEVSDYDIEIRGGFTPLKPCVYTASAGQSVLNYRDTITDKSKIKQMLFGEFSKCLYPLQKFDSDTERRFSIIAERDGTKWFKPAKGQFLLYYKDGIEHPEYVPDFVIETDDAVLMVETKAKNEMQDKKVLAKAEAAVKWCENASEYLLKHKGKEWKYLLVPHDEVKEQNNLENYVLKFKV